MSQTKTQLLDGRTSPLVFPSGNGTSGQVLSTDGSGALSWVDRFSAAGPAFRAYRSSNQSASNANWNKVQIDTETFDTANCFDTSSNRFTPTAAGYYLISGSVNIEVAGGVKIRCIATFYVNGVIVSRGTDIVSSTDGGSYGSAVTNLIYLNGSSDYVEFYSWVESGTSAAITGGSALTYFQAYLARPA